MRKRAFSRLLISLGLLLVFSSFACGKKGPPTLRSYEKPDAPVLHAMHREDTIILQWTYPKAKETEISGFVLMKSSGGDFSPVGLREAKSRLVEDKDFTQETTYRYKLLARNVKDVLSNDSNTVVVTPSEPPRPPEGISSRTEGMALVLTWEGAGGDVLYNIYKGYEQGTYGAAPVNATPLQETSFRDSLDIYKTVYYTVRSITKKAVPDEGRASAEFVVSPAGLVPSAPENIRSFAAADSVYLSWDASPEPWTTGYRVYRRIENREFVRIGETQIPSFRDGESPAVPRDYRVTAVGPVSEGKGGEVRGIIHLPQQ